MYIVGSLYMKSEYKVLIEAGKFSTVLMYGEYFQNSLPCTNSSSFTREE